MTVKVLRVLCVMGLLIVLAVLLLGLFVTAEEVPLWRLAIGLVFAIAVLFVYSYSLLYPLISEAYRKYEETKIKE